MLNLIFSVQDMSGKEGGISVSVLLTDSVSYRPPSASAQTPADTDIRTAETACGNPRYQLQTGWC